jgi:hypothetical protein
MIAVPAIDATHACAPVGCGNAEVAVEAPSGPERSLAGAAVVCTADPSHVSD